jgi:protein-S-isoprenylcysteine O-methyltransferase Ste14
MNSSTSIRLPRVSAGAAFDCGPGKIHRQLMSRNETTARADKREQAAMDGPNSVSAATAQTQTGLWAKLRRWLHSTPVRSFVVYPLVVIAFEMIRQGGTLRVIPWGVPLLIWGYLQYRLVGRYRRRHGGGGPGVDVLPQHLVSDGPYRYTRNPMYLGHLIFMAGLALAFWSWLAAAILLVNMIWFDLRVRGDEVHLLQHFGTPYADYCRRVKRWIPGLI